MTAPLPEERAAVARRAGWGLADQALSSLTNFGLFFLIARTVGASELGAVTVAFSCYLLALGASRALGSEPLAVRFSAVTPQVWRRAAAAATGVALAAGVVAAAVVVGASVLVGGLTGAALWPLGALLPGLLLQDAYRLSFFAAGRPAAAAANDAVWAAVQLSAVGWLLATGTPSVAALIAAWGGAAVVAAVVGAAQARLLPDVRGGVAWLREQRDLAPAYLGEFAVTTGANEAAALTIVAAADLAALGALRAAHVMVGPLSVLLMGVNAVAVPEGARLRARAPQRLGVALRWLSLGVAAGAVAWLGALLVVPDGVGVALLGENWRAGRAVIVPVGLAFVAHGLMSGPIVGVRVLERAREGFEARTVVAVLGLTAKTVGAAVAGAWGAALGQAGTAGVGVAAWWRQLHRVLPPAARAAQRSGR